MENTRKEMSLPKMSVWILFVLALIWPAGCGKKDVKEVQAVITEAVSTPAGLTFRFTQDWIVQEEEQLKESLPSGSVLYHDLLATHSMSGSSISIVYEDLTLTKGASLIRMKDYIHSFQESLRSGEDYSYSYSEVEIQEVFGEEYYTFTSQVPEVSGRQYFYIRRIEDEIMVMTITLYGEDSPESILGLGDKSVSPA